MNADRFHTVLRALSRPRTRRGALASLLAGLLAPLAPSAVEGERGRGGGRKKRDRQRERKRKAPTPNQARAAAACFTGRNCGPGPGKNLSSCDYGDSSTLRGRNLKGANLTSANLADADVSRANLGGANLGKTCLVDADLTGATINGSTNTGGAVFCRTTMPNGTINDSGCAKGTACCPTCIAEDQACGPGIGGACCDGLSCSGGRCVEACDVCPSGCPFDTLQDAIDAAAEGGAIHICPGTYRTIDARVNKERLTIVGAGNGTGGTVLDGDGQDRVLTIDSVAATIRDLTVTGGAPPLPGQSLGGGIFVSSLDATLERVTISANENDLTGGGVTVFPSDSTLVMRDCAVTDNRLGVEGQGGGIYTVGKVTLERTAVSGNVIPDGTGGGIYNTTTGILNLTANTRVTRNRAERGGGVGNQGQLTVSGGSAITGNTGGDCENFGMGTGCPI